MKVMRKEFSLGLGCLALFFILKHLTNTPSLVLYIIVGSGLILEITGILPEKVYSSLKEYIKNITNRK